jgi:hypothetical protein
MENNVYKIADDIKPLDPESIKNYRQGPRSEVEVSTRFELIGQGPENESSKYNLIFENITRHEALTILHIIRKDLEQWQLKK